MIKFKIKPESCNDKEEEWLVYEVVEDRGDRVLAKLFGSPYKFKIEPTEVIMKSMIEEVV